jgi:hypothetical protein
MTHERPEDGRAFILEVLASDNSTPVVESLSAGPLEDLLTYHGATLIDRVEAEARRNPKFASLLGGVWKNAMSDDTWRRVQGVWTDGAGMKCPPIKRPLWVTRLAWRDR